MFVLAMWIAILIVLHQTGALSNLPVLFGLFLLDW